MLAAFTTATNGHIGYANSSSDTPVYWKSVEALADEHIGTLEIGEIENPSNISIRNHFCGHSGNAGVRK